MGALPNGIKLLSIPSAQQQQQQLTWTHTDKLQSIN